MSAAEHHQKRVQSCIDEINKSKHPAVIFGADRGGWYIMKVLESFGVPIAAFADNAQIKHGTFHDHPVYSPEEVAGRYPDAHVFLGLLNFRTAAVIRKQLQLLLFQKIHYAMDAFLFVYMTSIAGRKCEKEILARSISQLHGDSPNPNGHFSPPLSYMITQKCTLRCRECGTFVPAFRSPRSIPTEKIIQDLKTYCQAFDLVHSVALIGGEPFLHPDILQICRAAASIPNLLFTDVVTNGTILPCPEKFDELFELGTCVTISDYGVASKRLAEVESACRNTNIFYYLYRFDHVSWSKVTPILQHHRNEDENTQIYKKCIECPKTCCVIMNGELHRCSFSCMTSYLGLIPRCEEDFVLLDDSGPTDQQRAARIRSFIHRETAPRACDFCIAWKGDPVPAGVQLPRPAAHACLGGSG